MSTPGWWASPSPGRLDFRRKKAALEGESRRYSRMLSSFSYSKVKAYFLSRGCRQGVEVHQVNPAFSSVVGRVKFMERYGLSVHQAAALALPVGCSVARLLGCSVARLLGEHPPPAGLSRGQWRACRLHRTREEASEARMDVLGCGLGSAETGACSAAPAGEAARQPQSGSGCRADQWSAGWLERGPVRCSRVRFPGGAVLQCWGGGASPFGQRLRKG